MGSTPPDHLVALIEREGIAAEFFDPGVPMHTVSDAASAIGVDEEHVLKTLLFGDGSGNHVVAIASGNGRVDRHLLAGAAGLGKLRMVDPDTVLRLTGYPAGGVAPIAHLAAMPVVVDQQAASLDEGYGGGGAPELLLRLRLVDIIRITGATVAPIVAPSEPHRP